MTNPTLRAVTASAVESLGWRKGNHGENRLIMAMHRLGVRPRAVEQQFSLGPYRLDVAFPAERIAIEADGWVHTAVSVRRRDRERDRQLERWGWWVIRIDIDADDDELDVAVATVLRWVEKERTRGAPGDQSRGSDCFSVVDHDQPLTRRPTRPTGGGKGYGDST